jgi:putative FmdB family regulatory protein
MPIYDYGCEDCGEYFSEQKKMAQSEEKAACEGCGAPAPRIVSQGATFVLKGSGWADEGYGSASR